MSSEVIKSELISELASIWTNHPEEMVADATNLILESITKELAQDGRVEIRGFGSFSVHHCPARTAHNPKSGAAVTVPEKRRPHFKPGKELKELVNQSREQS